ncbi:hypothetical protein DZF91_38165 [Actinomadura logoneensis]|uniref:DUF559 domain-containing protein n=1 Tax=Actinomadura logoneensis TaxID=2293572 RepID=A0A372J914_9ACTN|nr:hypothetical protein [Actinomadura logoneensis]RFU36419.1 hypothetical protein DZF91_38165 [Actinomadura logoneensis]
MSVLTWTKASDHTIRPLLDGRPRRLADVLPVGAVIARATAAWLWGLDVLPPGARRGGWELDLVLPPESAPPDAEPDPRRVPLPSDHVALLDGVRVTSRARTALDCARWLPRLDAVAALDQFLRAGVGEPELRAMARGLPGYRGSARLAEVFRLSDRGAASPGESRTRVLVVRAGFPRPRTQIPVPGPHGERLFIDLGYEQWRVGLEYDGERHHTGRPARAHDDRRRRWLRDQGWKIIPVTRDVLVRPTPYLEALLTALLDRGWQPDDRTMDRLATHLARLHNGTSRRAQAAHHPPFPPTPALPPTPPPRPPDRPPTAPSGESAAQPRPSVQTATERANSP